MKVILGKLTRDLETFGKQDPYVKIIYMGQPFKTRVHENGGKNPIWNQEFTFRINSPSDDITIECKDDDVVGAKMIGRTVVKASTFCFNNGVKGEYVTLTDMHGKSIGQIQFDSKFVPDNRNALTGTGSMPTAVPVMMTAPVVVAQPPVY